MDTETCTFGKKTVALLLTDNEEKALDKMAKNTGIKRKYYIRNLVINDLKKNGWLPQESEEKGN